MLAAGMDFSIVLRTPLGAFFMPKGETMSESTNLIIAIATVVAALVLFVFACFDKERFSTRSIAFGAICLALSFGLSYIRIFRMPQGGSITPASMLPVILYAYIFGAKKGVLIGLAYAGLQSIQDLFFVHPLQYILDYPLAFMIIGIVGFAKYIPAIKLSEPKKVSKYPTVEKIKHWLYVNLNGYPAGIIAGILVACTVRFVCHTVSGVVFFAEYAGGGNVWVYSLGYNSFVWVECAICLAAGGLLLANRSVRKLLAEISR